MNFPPLLDYPPTWLVKLVTGSPSGYGAGAELVRVIVEPTGKDEKSMMIAPRSPGAIRYWEMVCGRGSH